MQSTVGLGFELVMEKPKWDTDYSPVSVGNTLGALLMNRRLCSYCMELVLRTSTVDREISSLKIFVDTYNDKN